MNYGIKYLDNKVFTTAKCKQINISLYINTKQNYNLAIFQNKKIIYANKFFCWQALKIDLIQKIYFMFNDYIETLVLEQI